MKYLKLYLMSALLLFSVVYTFGIYLPSAISANNDVSVAIGIAAVAVIIPSIIALFAYLAKTFKKDILQ